MKKTRRVAAVLAAITLLAAGCGFGDTTAARDDQPADSSAVARGEPLHETGEDAEGEATDSGPAPSPSSSAATGEGSPWTRLPLPGVECGPDPAHRLDVHPPVDPNGLAVLWLHAGGWTSGDRSGTGVVTDEFVAQGAFVFSADYRLTPDHTFPAQIHDVKRAIRFIKSRRSYFPYRRLVVAGASAGGHLAALAATSAGALEPTDLPPELSAHDSSVDGAISLSGPMDLTRFWKANHEWAKALSDGFLGCDGADCDEARMLEASPLRWVDASDPALYLAAGTADTLVTAADNADRMWDVVQAQGDPTRCWYDRVDGGTHNIWDTLNLTRLERFLARFDLVRAATAVSTG